MKSHLANAAFGVIDYLAYPLGLLLLAPVILHELGVERYGMWSVACAVFNTGAIVASGFGDANIRSVAVAHGSDRRHEVVEAIRATLGIHLVLGLLIAAGTWASATAIARSTTKMHPAMLGDCIWALRITALLILLRAVETVCVSTHRAFARYGRAIQVSVCARILSLIAAVLVPLADRSVAAVMLAMLVIALLAVCTQMVQLCRVLGVRTFAPLFDRQRTGSLLGFGIYTWLQAVAVLLFGQADRIIAGVMFGAAMVSSYAFCVQLTQPIYGLTAAGLHFLFPYVATHAGGDRRALRRSVLSAFAVNAGFVGLSLTLLLLFGKAILLRWDGPSIAVAADPMLPAIAWSSALAALGVTGGYSLLAMGRARAVTLLNIAGGLAFLAAIPVLVPRYGSAGLAYARLFFGPFALLVYVPLAMSLMRQSTGSKASLSIPACEEV